MAIDSTNKTQAYAGSRDEGMGIGDIASAILAPLASLKLTVFLLVMAVIVTFIATIDQTRHDILDVKHKHFQNVFVQVPFQTLFVPRWAPDHQNVPGSFYIPSGVSILVMMLLNLTAAHLLRFRLHAKGLKLVIGIIAALIAGGLTWAIIFNGQNASGFQAEPPISWKSMWILLQIAVLALACSTAFGYFTIDRKRFIEKYLLLGASMVLAGVLGISMWLGDDAFIGDSAMRILWQLAQSTIAATVSLGACVILFRRKAGIVLLHLGIAGLMFNEIYVTATNEEHRMTIVEGQTVSQALDVRSTELAVIDTSDPEFDEIVVVPGSKLEAGDDVRDDALPFNVTCIEYMSNSDVRRVRDPAKNQATVGSGLRFEAFDLPITTGTDSEQTVDSASAYVRLSDKKSNEPIGTYLVSQNFLLKNADTVTVDGKPYRIELRFKTDYQPFSMTLKDVRAEYYLATQTPSSYSSDVVLNDVENGTVSDQKIWMNNPLRYSDQTFYQSSLGTMKNGDEYTVLQVVKNKGWMIPYVCCMFTVVGLLWQFGGTLLAYLLKNRQAAEKEMMVRLAKGIPAPRSNQKQWIATYLLVGFFGLWGLGEAWQAQTSKVEKDGMRLDLLGELPITQNGRVQPLGSFARNTARQLSKRESIWDGTETKQPAIRWLADTIFEAEGYKGYRAFRIEDQNILSALDLPLVMPTPERAKNKFRYSLQEMLDAQKTLMGLIPNPDEVEPDLWSPFQKKLSLEASQPMQRVFGARLTFGNPTLIEDEPLIDRLEKAGRDVTSPLIPLVVPSDDPEKPWKSFVSLQNNDWLNKLAKEYDSETTPQLSRKIIEKEILPPLRDDMIKSRIIQQFIADPAMLGDRDPREFAKQLRDSWDEFPSELLGKMVEAQAPFIDAMLATERPRYEKVMEEQLAKINGESGPIVKDNSELGSLLLKLRPAYQSGDAETFNGTLETYLAAVRATPPEGMSPLKLKVEKIYSGMDPFYLAMVIYLVAFLVATFAWVGGTEMLNRASFSLLVLGLSIQIIGLVMRVVISGRPPVTNLYSSALFVSAVFVLIMLVFERSTKMGIGNVLAGKGAFAALMWAWSMSIEGGDTFSVLVAVLDTQFWLSTHVVIITIGYAVTFAAGFLGLAYVVAALVTPVMLKKNRRQFGNIIYGAVCFGLLASFFGTVLGGLWGDDSWGRFWGWDPKENGALMIVLWNAVVLHARWGGIVRERGLASLAIIGNIVTLWSWKGVNAMGVGLHAYAGTQDKTVFYILLAVAAHIFILCLAMIPTRFWMSYAKD